MSFSYFDDLPTFEKSRYEAKLEVAGLQQCPYKEPAGKWVSDPTKWPDITYGDIYCYLIESPGPFDRKALKNWRSLESYKAVMEGWVQEVLFLQTTKCQVFTASVRPSQRMNETPHKPWVAVESTGSVLAAHCNCMAGLGESCTHVGGLMWKIEMAVRLGYTNKAACTDVACAWNADYVKKVQPAEISKVTFYSNSNLNKIAGNRKRPYARQIPAPTEEEELSFIRGLSTLEEKPIILSTYLETCEPWKKLRDVPLESDDEQRLPRSLTSLFDESYTELDRKDLLEKGRSLDISVTLDQVHYLEEVTREQSKCLIWHEQRKGRITSSVAHSVLHTSQKSPSSSLMAKICSPPLSGSAAANAIGSVPAIKWGRENEEIARTCFCASADDQHQNLRVEKTGLALSPNAPFLAASPDGLIRCDCHEARLLEIKCPYSLRDASEEEAYAKKDFPLIGHDIKQDHPYYAQIQHQLSVWNIAVCEFVVWTPGWTKIVSVDKNDTFVKAMNDTFCKIFYNHILPAMMTGAKDTNVPPKLDNQTYCTCKEDRDSDLIGCDGQDCPIEWYHIECVNMKKVPKRSWFCSLCKGKGTTGKRKAVVKTSNVKKLCQ